ncbi:hypothetical protein ACFONH_26370 [Streptomonospora nanhaiensis]|uniref:Uncharacterized protein n=1 Tax=Streptomonospora nanhaiensis TaxID=1323731 RepID=A0A853BWT4_9ACTN|nr:hypothetical protein [Streptomonospora nanhaiensis]MBV2366894.1 hypothetical protein [Streptomonospora nanhaiensis]MBX9390798.1 hypothetical protein [Streptomonospora nanhaiensis]NYI99215.1 hypothetical protein [Streptomonospora nanhaiensis]
MEKPSGNDSFSLLYRVGFRINYALLHVMGPAALTPETDPLLRTKKEYERRRDLHLAWKAHQRP